MELSEKDKFDLEWQFNHQRINPASSSLWNPISSSSQCPSVSMVDSFCSDFYNQPTTTQGKPLPSSWNPGILSHFQIDSGFIERAARFSSFTSGNFSAIVNNNSFTANASKSPMADQRDNKESNNESGEAEFSGDCLEEATNSSHKANGANKRKGSNQDMELDQVQGASSHSVQTTKENLDSKKKGEKKAKDVSDEQKGSYIHVRAQRGQATNSHSLAERVRREKISQRMKFLQELVPGCSKVTGKAVMLDEIINYVQSLQRQVEFLSMKLASVNPRLDFNVEGLSSKDHLQLYGGSSSAIGILSDMIQPQLHPSHLNLVQAGIPSMVNSSDAIKRAINSQINSISGFKDIAHQMPNAWEDELHNVIQMNFGSNAPLNAQELNDKPHEGFPI